MKYLLPFLLLFLLCWAVLWTQTTADITTKAQVDTLLAQKKFTAAANVISAEREDSIRAGLWNYFASSARDQVEANFEADSIPIERSMAILDSALLILKKADFADSIAAAGLWTWKALLHRLQEQYSEALDAYESAIRIFETNKDYKNKSLAYCYNHVAQAYIRRHDYLQADKNLKASLKSDTSFTYLFSNYSQLANNAYWWDSLDLGMKYFETGMRLFETNKNLEPDANALASLRSAGANILIKKGRYREAESLARQAMAYYQKDPDVCDNQIRSHTTMAEIAAGTGRLREAEMHYIQAWKIGTNCFTQQKRKSREMAKLYCEWGDFLMHINRDSEALVLYQKALVQAFPAFDNLDPDANPSPADAPIEVWAMNAPARKARVLLHKPALEARISAADCFDLASAAAKQLRRAYGTDEAKLYFVQHNFDIQREATLNLWALYRETGHAEYLSRLFKMLEGNRANTLRDALQEQRAFVLAGIPDSLQNLEEKLRIGCAEAQTLLADADSATSELRQTALNRLERRYDDLLRFLKKTYPRFREYSEAGQTAQLDAIQKALPAKAVLLSFFDAGDRYLCLALRQTSGLSGYEIPRDSSLDQTLSRFQLVLADKSRQEADPAAFFADAWFLKQRLLPDSILKGAGNLVIVPDGPLAYLPFEALLTAPHTGSYGKAPYLLRAHAVQYAWSAALLTETGARQLPEKFMLHVAPFAGGARNGLAPLTHSMREIPEDASADQLQGDQALADSFLNRSAAYDVLHLSTHAHAGQKEQPGIEFSDRTVALPELYAQRLNASLVALSACETNAGQFAEGEGVLSLARAFAYAGARSLVAGYWSVNDRSTANLFAAFYRHLKSGLTKSEALRQAKLDMLAEPGADARKMPYHWAAFTLSGADGPVAMAGSGCWWQWVLLVFAGTGLMWLARRRFGRKRAI